MSRYLDHPQVAPRSSGYTVTGNDGTEYAVLHTNVFGWTICHGPNLDYVPTTDGGFAIGFRNADDAISALVDTHTATDTDDNVDGM